ncbi:MAG: hypothetical protein FJY11_01985 [Bacteroidetes bacterium]|nr:hypothetical protein [Bacteroidota bacterium]
MKPEDLINIIDEAPGLGKSPGYIREKLRSEGVEYSFGSEFTSKVIRRIYGGAIIVNRQMELVRSLNSVFYRVAFAGVAAIILLLISIFVMEGSLTFNSLVGISESYDETLIGLLTDH